MNTQVIYYGMDVAKATLELAGPAGGRTFANTARGHAQLLGWLAAQPGPAHVVAEATGGWERAVAGALQAAAVLVSIVNARQVRDYARATGRLAKTDRIDAVVLGDYGRACGPVPTPAASPAQVELTALAQEHRHVVRACVRERNRLEHLVHPPVLRLARARVRQLERQAAQIQEQLAQVLAAHGEMADRAARLEQVCGIGRKTAVNLLAFLPELGRLRPGRSGPLQSRFGQVARATVYCGRASGFAPDALPGRAVGEPVQSGARALLPAAAHPGQARQSRAHCRHAQTRRACQPAARSTSKYSSMHHLIFNTVAEQLLGREPSPFSGAKWTHSTKHPSGLPTSDRVSRFTTRVVPAVRPPGARSTSVWMRLPKLIRFPVWFTRLRRDAI